MSITKELRRYAARLDEQAAAKSEHGFSPVALEINRIADRIDQEHEAEVFDLLREHDEWVHDRDANYIQLPKDADGETIHLGDRVSWDNGTFNVHELNLTADGWTTWDELHGYTVHADQCHHVTPDSWERIIEDAAKNIYPNGAFNPCWDEVRDSLVERCKRLAGEDA